MIRLLFLLHRYLGIAVGALMVMWCLSGVVMMYVSYPALDESLRLKNLAVIDWSGCCRIPDSLPADESFGDFRIEMLAGRPVLITGGHSCRLIDLITGSAIDRVSPEQAASVAMAFAAGSRSGTGPPRLLGLIDYDQWTVSGSFDADRPLYHFALNDGLRTELYVSSATGQAVQISTARERFWNWLGAVPHWLYFAELRHRGFLWTQIVIYTSLMGCFLAGIGIYIGVLQMTRQPRGSWSPYRGFNWWHHMAGLIFGVCALTWVLSGLLSMSPWGWLEAADARAEVTAIRGAAPPSIARIGAALQAIAAGRPAQIVSLKTAPFNGKDYFITSTAGGERRRIDGGGALSPLNTADLMFLGNALRGSATPTAPELLMREDAFYFTHHRDTAPLPVYRIIRSGSRYYIDPVSGMLLAKIDGNAQAHRWLHEGLHRLDFTASLRGRPQWDALMWLLMSGVTLLCVTGAYLGARRLLRS
jgi:PepSY-associated TM region